LLSRTADSFPCWDAGSGARRWGEISVGYKHAGRNISLCTHLNPLSD